MIPDLFQRSLLERNKTALQPHVGTFRAEEGPDADSLSLLNIIMPIKSLPQQPSLVGSATPLWKLVLPYLAARTCQKQSRHIRYLTVWLPQCNCSQRCICSLCWKLPDEWVVKPPPHSTYETSVPKRMSQTRWALVAGGGLRTSLNLVHLRGTSEGYISR